MDIDPRVYTVSIFLVSVCAMHHWFYENKYIETSPKGMFMNVYFIASFFAVYFAYLMAKQQRMIDF